MFGSRNCRIPHKSSLVLLSMIYDGGKFAVWREVRKAPPVSERIVYVAIVGGNLFGGFFLPWDTSMSAIDLHASQ